jgi:hypothetical protein
MKFATPKAVAAILYTVICVSTPTSLPADLSFNFDKNAAQVTYNNLPLSDRSVRLVVQEWKQRESNAHLGNQVVEEINTVGSIVETEVEDIAFLSPLENAWNQKGKRIRTKIDDAIVETLELSNELKLNIIYEKKDDHLIIKGVLINTSKGKAREERPVTLSVAIPVDIQGLEWWTDNHQKISADTPRELITPISTMAGARGTMSRYPFAAMTSPNYGLALGMPLDEPRIHRIRWDGKEKYLIAEVDVTLSPMPEKFPNTIPFEFWLFDFQPEFGFRGAARAYYDLTPESYNLRLTNQGQWMPFTQLTEVNRVEDFGFVYHEYHPNVSVAYNNENNIESLVYCEPPVQYINLDVTTPRELEVLNEIIENKTDRQGAQVRTSYATNASGDMEVAWVETPWAVGARVATNGDPDLPRTTRNHYNSFDINWLAYQDLYRKRAEDKPLYWEGDATIQDGVLGGTNRTLVLRENATITQKAQLLNSTSTVLKLSGMVKSNIDDSSISLSITTNEKKFSTPEVTAGKTFTRFELELDISQAEAPPSNDIQVTLTSSINGTVWLEDLSISGIALKNGSFDEGVGDPEAVTGLYLDSFEGWDSKDLNFRREHFKYTDIPLTFDTQTGKAAQVIMMHNFELAAEARKRLHKRGHLLMANTALYQWTWSAHYLDILGIETGWGEGPRISPPRIEEMDYVRTMLYHKPYCYLQNLRYENFRGEKVEHYFARCFHYGFWPGFFSHNAAEAPYWLDPSLYEADRPIFLKYTRPQQLLTSMGWEPITLAKSSDPAILVERWGGGAFRGNKPLSPDMVAFTLYNPSSINRTSELVPHPLLLSKEESYLAVDVILGRQLSTDPSNYQVSFDLDSFNVANILYIKRNVPELLKALKMQVDEFILFEEKYQRFGFIQEKQLASTTDYSQTKNYSSLSTWYLDAKDKVEPIYHNELDRAYRLYSTFYSAYHEEKSGNRLNPQLPVSITPGERFEITVSDSYKDRPLNVIITSSDGNVLSSTFTNGVAKINVPENLKLEETVNLSIQTQDGTIGWPRFETVLGVQPAVSVIGIPEEIVLATSRTVEVVFRNNLQHPQQGHLTISGPAPLDPSIPQEIMLPANTEQVIELSLTVSNQREHDDVRDNLLLEWKTEDGGEGFTQKIPIVLLPRDASILRTSDIVVRADSTYFGYNLAPLTDGLIDTEELDWQESAWASDEGMVPHWVEFEFAEPTEISDVRIHWARDSGQVWTSQLTYVEVLPATSESWLRVGVHQEPSSSKNSPSKTSQFNFDPVSISKLRLYQPAGKGPIGREGLLWLGEVEVR